MPNLDDKFVLKEFRFSQGLDQFNYKLILIIELQLKKK
jgi:hypothetical protein